jgi:hypothetical protein
MGLAIILYVSTFCVQNHGTFYSDIRYRVYSLESITQFNCGFPEILLNTFQMSLYMGSHDRSSLCSTSLPFRFLARSLNGNNVSRNYAVDMKVPTLIGTKSKYTFIQEPCSRSLQPQYKNQLLFNISPNSLPTVAQLSSCPREDLTSV